MNRYNKLRVYFLKGLELILQLIRTKLLIVYLGVDSFGTFALFQSNFKMLQNVAGIGHNKTYLNERIYRNAKVKTLPLNGYFIIAQIIVLLTGILIFSIYYSSIDGLYFVVPAFLGILGTYYTSFLKVSGDVLLLSVRSLVAIFLLLLLTYLGVVLGLSLMQIVALGYLSSLVLFKKAIRISYSWSGFKHLSLTGAWYMMLSVIVMGAPLLVRTKIWQSHPGQGASFYAAWWTLINTYVGIFFVTLPGLYISKYVGQNNRSRLILRNFLESSLYLVFLVLGLMLFFDMIIGNFYSIEFIAIKPMFMASIPGLFLKSLSWQIGFSFSVSGDVKGLTISDVSFGVLFASLMGLFNFKLDYLGYTYSISYAFVVVSQLLYLYYVNRKGV